MSAEYLEVISWKKTKNDKNFAVRIGSAKKLDNGNIVVYLDALPLPGPDGCQLTISPKRASQVAPPREQDDEIPFN